MKRSWRGIPALDFAHGYGVRWNNGVAHS